MQDLAEQMFGHDIKIVWGGSGIMNYKKKKIEGIFCDRTVGINNFTVFLKNNEYKCARLLN